MNRASDARPLGVRVLMLVVRCYPKAFRHDYGAEMLSVLRQRWSDVHTKTGWWGVVRLFARTAFDLCIGLPSEWRNAVRTSRSRFARSLPPPRKSGDSLMRSVLQDARMAVRALIRQPMFAIVAVTTLALGVGANTAIFSLVNRVLLEPLPYPDSDQLVRVWSSNAAQGRDRYFTSPLAFYEWRERTESFDEIAAAWPREVTMTDDLDAPIRLNTMSVTPNWFDALGVTPQHGRLLQPDDAGITWGSWVLILSDGLWRDRFGADPNVVGSVARIEGQPAEIIGVLPPGAGFPETVELFTNFLPPRTQSALYLDVIARVKPGFTKDMATAELANVARGLADEFPGIPFGLDDRRGSIVRSGGW